MLERSQNHQYYYYLQSDEHLWGNVQEYRGSKRDRKELSEWKERRGEEVERLAKEKGAWDRQQKGKRRKRQKTGGKKRAEVCLTTTLH